MKQDVEGTNVGPVDLEISSRKAEFQLPIDLTITCTELAQYATEQSSVASNAGLT